MRIYRSAIILFAAVMVATIGIVMSPSPSAPMTDFDHATEVITKVEVIRHDQGNSDYFDLVVSTQSDRLYYLRRPEPANVRRYAAALPVGHEVSVRYRSDFDGKRIYDIREGDQVYIPFAELIKEVAEKRALVLQVGVAPLLVLGVIGMVWEIKQRRQTSVPATN